MPEKCGYSGRHTLKNSATRMDTLVEPDAADGKMPKRKQLQNECCTLWSMNRPEKRHAAAIVMPCSCMECTTAKTCSIAHATTLNCYGILATPFFSLSIGGCYVTPSFPSDISLSCWSPVAISRRRDDYEIFSVVQRYYLPATSDDFSECSHKCCFTRWAHWCFAQLAKLWSSRVA